MEEDKIYERIIKDEVLSRHEIQSENKKNGGVKEWIEARLLQTGR